MTLDEAIRLTVKATELAVAHGVAIAIAAVDAGGHLVTLHRMDGVPFIATEIAWGKAWTAAAWGEASADQAAKAAALPQFATAITVASGGRYTPQAGGIPIRRGSDVIGALGASGLASGQTDEHILQQAIAETLGCEVSDDRPTAGP
jgi:uncharacterized protein GlcG (DUF336 family)